MPSSTITIDQLPEAMERWLAEDRSRADLAMRQTAEAVKALAVRNAQTWVRPDGRPAPVVDTGQLVRSYLVERIPGGWRLENVAAHAAHMEHGTRPHWAPLAPLLAWASRKLRGSPRRPTRDAMALAIATQRAIARRGLQARRFHQRAVAKSPEILRRVLRNLMRRSGR